VAAFLVSVYRRSWLADFFVSVPCALLIVAPIGAVLLTWWLRAYACLVCTSLCLAFKLRARASACTSPLLADWSDGFRMFPGEDNLIRLMADR
jgi:hypothetical protein